MANSSKSSVQSKRTSMGKQPCNAGGMLDHLAPFDTRYPNLRSQRRLPGNGPAPENPFGGRIATPTEK